jgi:hypothetical protein
MVKLLHVGLSPFSSHLLSLAVKFRSPFLTTSPNQLGIAEHKSQVTSAMISEIVEETRGWRQCFELQETKNITTQKMHNTKLRIFHSSSNIIT